MGLFDGILLDDGAAAPQRPVAPKSGDIPYTVTIKRASNGDEILLCSATPPPAGAIALARSRKMPLFTFDEIPAMRQIPASSLDVIIQTRRIMGWGGPVIVTMECA